MALTRSELNLAVAVAAQDERLMAFYELVMRGDTGIGLSGLVPVAATGADASCLAEVIQRDYDLSPGRFRQVLGRCVASVAGVQVGRDYFTNG